MNRDVKRWLYVSAVLVLAGGMTVSYLRWRSLGSEQRFMRIKNGMTLGEVRATMGREEDDPETAEERAEDPKDSTRTWFGGHRMTFHVGFDSNGRVLGKAIRYHPKLGKRGYHDGEKLPPSAWDGPPGR